MKCFNCGCELTANDFCTNCGADIKEYRRIVRISNRYYNEGLTKAGIRDLSGAVLSLRASLKMNRTNIDARNLLGLVYFEMGEAVAAFSHWVVSKNLKPEKNIADDFIEAVQGNPGRLSVINQSIKKYNQALAYAKQGSLDLAVIQLKKVIQMNPNLVVAYELLGLLYLEAREYGRAKKVLNQASRIDRNNTRILYYMKEAEEGLTARYEGEKGRDAGRKGNESADAYTYRSGNETIIQPVNVENKKNASTMLNLIIGVAIGCAAMFFLVMPARISRASGQMNDQLKAVSDELTSKNADLEEQNKRIEALQNENATIKGQLEDLTGSSGMVERYDYLAAAALNYIKNPDDVLGTETMLGNIQSGTLSMDAATGTKLDPTIYSQAFRDLYEYLNGDVASEAASSYITKGRSELEAHHYQSAIENLLKASEIDPNNDEALYYLAESYKGAGDSVHATQIYSRIVNEMADSIYAERSKDSLENGAAGDTGGGGGNADAGANNADDDALAQALVAQALGGAAAGAADVPGMQGE